MLSQSKSVKKIQYSNIDLFKLIFAIIVVSIHTLRVNPEFCVNSLQDLQDDI